MRNRQSGFTLIELMIVVAIVGVLAAVAVPAYSDYTVRAKVTEAIAAVSPIKASVADYYYANGSLPRSSAAAGLDINADAYATDVVKGIIVKDDPEDATIEVSFKDLGDGGTEDKTLLFVPDVTEGGQITWECKAGLTTSSLPTRFAPANCRG